MTEPAITSAVLCKEVQFPDGPEGPATLAGVFQEIVFLADYQEPVAVGQLYLAIEGDADQYALKIRWRSQSSGAAYQMVGTFEAADGRVARGVQEMKLPDRKSVV